MDTLERRSPKVPTNTGQRGQAIRKTVRDGIDLALRVSRGLSALGPEDLDAFEQLLVTIAESPTVSPSEVVKTIQEFLCPDEHIGGIDKMPRVEDPATRASVNDSRKFIGYQIKHYRDKAGLTQIELARKARIPQSHVCRLECGKHAPSHKTIDRIAKALRVKPSLIDPGRSDD